MTLLLLELEVSLVEVSIIMGVTHHHTPPIASQIKHLAKSDMIYFLTCLTVGLLPGAITFLPVLLIDSKAYAASLGCLFHRMIMSRSRRKFSNE